MLLVEALQERIECAKAQRLGAGGRVRNDQLLIGIDAEDNPRRIHWIAPQFSADEALEMH